MHRYWPHWPWAGTVILLCAALASAASIPGATASVENIDQTTGVATIQITNISTQGIAAFTIMVTGIRASGKKEFDQHVEDYGPPIAFQKYGLLDQGKSVQLNINLGAQINDPLVHVEAEVVSAIYADQTAEATNEKSFQHQIEARHEMANAVQKTVKILQDALSDPTENHPAAKAIPNAKEALLSAEQKHESKGLLSSLEDRLDHIVKTSPNGAIERDALQKYLAEEQQRAAALATYTQVRRIQ